jgi:HK97 family phage portal protein
MDLLKPFRREKRESLEEILLKSGVLTGKITKEQAMSIPMFSACVELISSTVASLPIYLYKTDEDTTETVEDEREDLLNGDTGDTLNGFEMKKNAVVDFLLEGGGYIYINRNLNNVKSLHYVDHQFVNYNYNYDPIYKKGEFLVFGQTYRDFEFIKLLRRSKNGFFGKGIVKENNKMLSIAFNEMIYEEVQVKTGGSKRGFLKSQGRLSQPAIEELKKGWKDLYSTKADSDNVLVLNNGLDFQDASLTSVELEFNERKQTNADLICKMFITPPTILNGTANEVEYLNWVKMCIQPILVAFESALNKDLLLPSEQEKFHFAFDTANLLKSDIVSRYKAYEIGIKNAILQVDEVRMKENLKPLNLKFLKMGLQDVLYFPDTEEIYTPNTNQKFDINGMDTKNPNDNPNQNPANGGGTGENVQPNAGLNKTNGQPDNQGQNG